MIFIIHIPIVIDTVCNNLLEVGIGNDEFLIESTDDLLCHSLDDGIHNSGSLRICKIHSAKDGIVRSRSKHRLSIDHGSTIPTHRLILGTTITLSYCDIVVSYDLIHQLNRNHIPRVDILHIGTSLPEPMLGIDFNTFVGIDHTGIIHSCDRCLSKILGIDSHIGRIIHSHLFTRCFHGSFIQTSCIQKKIFQYRRVNDFHSGKMLLNGGYEFFVFLLILQLIRRIFSTHERFHHRVSIQFHLEILSTDKGLQCGRFCNLTKLLTSTSGNCFCSFSGIILKEIIVRNRIDVIRTRYQGILYDYILDLLLKFQILLNFLNFLHRLISNRLRYRRIEINGTTNGTIERIRSYDCILCGSNRFTQSRNKFTDKFKIRHFHKLIGIDILKISIEISRALLQLSGDIHLIDICHHPTVSILRISCHRIILQHLHKVHDRTTRDTMNDIILLV